MQLILKISKIQGIGKFKSGNMPGLKKKVIYIYILIILINIVSGCFGGSSKPYYYNKAYLDILTSPISNDEYNNSTLYSELFNEIETNFTNISNFEKEIYIWYNERIYDGYDNLNYNMHAQGQCSIISFLSNNSLKIESKVIRPAGLGGDFAESKTKAFKKAKDLYEHDKEFLDEQISIIIKIIISVYNVNVIFKEYDYSIEKIRGV
jgi:hypothetical protein